MGKKTDILHLGLRFSVRFFGGRRCWAFAYAMGGLHLGQDLTGKGRALAFWSVAIGLCIVVFVPVAAALLRPARAVDSAGTSDMQVYRDQLRGVDKDVARGVVSAEDAEALRVEISRRLLAADAAQNEGSARAAPQGLSITVAAGIGALVLVAGVALYMNLGAPGYPDLPLSARIATAEAARQDRPSQQVAEDEAARLTPPPSEERFDPDYIALVARLRAAVAERPDDIQGHNLLARQEASLANFGPAWRAKARAIQLAGDQVAAQDYVDLADLMVLAAGGYVSPEAEAALTRALQQDPSNGVARYYTGLMLMQTGRPDLAFNLWAGLLAEGPANAPWQGPIRAQIEDLAYRAGVDYTPPPLYTPSGPTAAQIAAAQNLSPADRMAMIEGMVTGLAERLATEGGPPADWARLIRAYGVLGQTEAAAQIWAEAQRVFPDNAARVPVLQAARDAGVAE